MSSPRTFASDNWSGIHPDIFAALAEANNLHAPAYGDDNHTEQVKKLMQREFGDDISTHLVLTGTAANVIAVAAMLQPGEDVVCAETAHIHTHEHGAHEKFSGTRLFLIPSKDGKVTPEALERRLRDDDVRGGNPRLLVITNATEYGTVYTAQETRGLADCAHRHELLVYVDGARLTNSAAALETGLADITTKAGVDAFSLGGTKNGMLCGDAIIFKDAKKFAGRGDIFRKFGLQNASKLRFVAAQFEAYMQNSLWRKIALQANDAAALLASELEKRSVPFVHKRQANMVWAQFPAAVTPALTNKYHVHTNSVGHTRLVTSWDTQADNIQDFTKWLDARKSNAGNG